jgi:antitoxin MazE
MRARVQKWGNSLAIRIPQPFARESELIENSPVDISLRNGKVVIAPVREAEYNIEDLVSKISKKNLHEEISTGKRRGNESW